MNPIQLIKSFIGEPQQLVSKLIGNQNPMFNNLVGMAMSGKGAEVETFARNFCKERGVDFDKEFASFMNNFR